MKKQVFLFELAGLFLCLMLVSNSVAAESVKKGRVIAAGERQFHPDWWKDSFLDIGDDAEEAWDEGKHLIIFLYLDGCPYCVKMAKENFNDSPYIDFLKEHFDVVQMNIKGSLEVTSAEDEVITEKELAEQLKVRFTPGLLFFNGEGEQVLRLDGYRPHKQFEPVLRYVASGAYANQSLSDYVRTLKLEQSGNYGFLENDNFIETNDLQALAREYDKPIMLIFEDKTCGTSCTRFHKELLADSEARRLMAMMSVVRWDALSSQKVRDPQGRSTTPADFAAQQGIVYRPGVVLIDRGEIRARRNSYAVLHHFLNGLEYIATRAYLNQSRREFSQKREQRILDSGKDIDLRIGESL